ncbi:hypothetical protein ASZ90_010081 [hydrocarbon metagenome]|uniref:Uncharacterized protein n=1 Tax=hydrocarbon metagenome TaxID=938273 RepID=A0A0W8FHE2_9ZZZZ
MESAPFRERGIAISAQLSICLRPAFTDKLNPVSGWQMTDYW